MIFYICSRCGQCGKPCDDRCHYTSNFGKSKLRNDAIKPARDVRFIMLNNGDWVQMSSEETVPVEDKLIAKPYRFLTASYDTLLQMETSRSFRRDKKKEKEGKRIIL